MDSVALEKRFKILCDEWHSTPCISSSVEVICDHPAYRAIIDLGVDVLPLIFRDMTNYKLRFWYIALRKITGENPVTDDMRGNFHKMSEAWLKWASDRGYLKQ